LIAYGCGFGRIECFLLGSNVVDVLVGDTIVLVIVNDDSESN
jgi:hypothetical protein